MIEASEIKREKESERGIEPDMDRANERESEFERREAKERASLREGTKNASSMKS